MGCHYRKFRPVGVLLSNVKSAANSAQRVSDGTRPSRARKQGHSKLDTTARYARVASTTLRAVKSPLEQLPAMEKKKKAS